MSYQLLDRAEYHGHAKKSRPMAEHSANLSPVRGILMLFFINFLLFSYKILLSSCIIILVTSNGVSHQIFVTPDMLYSTNHGR